MQVVVIRSPKALCGILRKLFGIRLSHGETPHYHRRYGVSLLSSAWGQVGPPRYGRQANSVLSDRFCVLI